MNEREKYVISTKYKINECTISINKNEDLFYWDVFYKDKLIKNGISNSLSDSEEEYREITKKIMNDYYKEDVIKNYYNWKNNHKTLNDLIFELQDLKNQIGGEAIIEDYYHIDYKKINPFYDFDRCRINESKFDFDKLKDTRMEEYYKIEIENYY